MWSNVLQTTNPLIARPLSGSPKCACFGPRHSPYSNSLYRATDLAAVGTILNVFSYDAVSDRDTNLSPSRKKRTDALHVSLEHKNVFFIHLYMVCPF